METKRRIYHEDELLAQRTNYFVAANAFLAVAFATLAVGPSSSLLNTLIAESAIVSLGVFLSYFQLAIGMRTRIAIQFWREIEGSGINDADVHDFWLFDFYRNAAVELWSSEATFSQGSIRAERPPNREHKIHYVSHSVRDSFPWRFSWVGSVNDVTGVLFPIAFATFWIVLSFTLEGLSWRGVPVGGLIAATLTGLALSVTILWKRAWPPKFVKNSLKPAAEPAMKPAPPLE